MRKSKGPTDPNGLSGRRRSTRLTSKYSSHSLPPSPPKSPPPLPSTAICHNLRSRSVAYPSPSNKPQSNSLPTLLSTPTPIAVVSAYDPPGPPISDNHDPPTNQALVHASPSTPSPSNPHPPTVYNRYGPRVRSPLNSQLEPHASEDEPDPHLKEDTDMQVDCLPPSDFKPDPTWPKQPPSFSIENPLIPYRPRDHQTDLWKSVCCERLSVVFKRYGVDTIRNFVRIQAETHGLETDGSPPSLAPATLSFTNSPFPATFPRTSPIQPASIALSLPQPATWYELHTPESLLNASDATDMDDDSDSDSDSDACPDNVSMDVDLDNCNLSLSLRAMEPMTESFPYLRGSSVLALHGVAEMWDCVERHPRGYIGRGTPVDEWRRGQWRLVEAQTLQHTLTKLQIVPRSDSLTDVSLDAYLAQQTCHWGPLLHGLFPPGSGPGLGSFPEPPGLFKSDPRPCEGDLPLMMFTQPSNAVLG